MFVGEIRVGVGGESSHRQRHSDRFHWVWNNEPNMREQQNLLKVGFCFGENKYGTVIYVV